MIIIYNNIAVAQLLGYNAIVYVFEHDESVRAHHVPHDIAWCNTYTSSQANRVN